MQAKVTIDNDAVKNVLDVCLGVDVSPDSNGAPVDNRPRLGKITIERRSDENTVFWEWALQPESTAWKSGKIEFLDPQGDNTVARTVEWQDGFIVSYQEIVPDVDKDKSSPQREVIQISARVLTIEGKDLVAYEAR